MKYRIIESPYSTTSYREDFNAVQLLTEVPAIAIKVMGYWCGYVGIFPNHSLYEVLYPELEVHGGVTYSNLSSIRDKMAEVKKVWWIGFDCGHYDDYLPGFPELYSSANYKDIDYVIAELEHLIEQLYS